MSSYTAREGNVPDQVLIVTGGVGAGHDGAAAELRARLERDGLHVEVRDFLDAVPRSCRLVLRNGYTGSVRYAPALFERVFQGIERGTWVHGVVDWMCRVAQRRVGRWTEGFPVVVSTYPLASQTLGHLRRAGRLHATVVTYLTDPAVHRLWVHPDVDHHVTVTEATAAMGTREFGVPMRAVGGLVSPTFEQEQTAAQRIATRRAVGLPVERRVALLVAGSEGMGEVVPTVDAIVASGVADVLVLCGRNDRLRRQLSGRDRVVALGWRSDVAALMAASDVLVHNAGGLSLTEALTAGLPAVTFRPIPAHGRANADLLARAGLVPWPQDDAELSAAIVAQCEAGRQDRQVVLHHQDASQLVRSLLNRGEAESLLSSGEQVPDAVVAG
ncbi:MGDG synthase family glycosyltransferase [Micromonospora inositola]|uniref:UDP-N-acetylglucosamine:LPS N-acetylglucosamine transferase n=1 Tax=Micromonospora inositola TaxID=47865 RepID=A0A1C5JHS1_9ACTN|nr:glycosyltransferase [Micromonospora inositola]SCG70100.1 UDP-N-acetylglucosamine:LPS N-acetylglucosamine transferase [Micromonospora inositola]